MTTAAETGRPENDALCQVEGCGKRHQWFTEPGLYLCQKHADAVLAPAPFSASEPHGTHTPCCAIASEHVWADPIRCLKDHEDWPCEVARAEPQADPLRAALDIVEKLPIWGHTSSSYKGTPAGAALLVRDDVLDCFRGGPQAEISDE
jgi:hypothetical protein